MDMSQHSHNEDDTILAIELLEAGVTAERIRELFQGRIHPHELDNILQKPSNKNQKLQEKDSDVDPQIKALVEEMRAPEKYLDPLYDRAMEDPIQLSSGVIFDRSSVVDAKNHLKYRRCPVTGDSLDDSFHEMLKLRQEVQAFKAIRERNVTEIARKMISSGDFDSFRDVLKGVEDYLEGAENDYLEIAREMVLMWSGEKKPSGQMLVVEKLNSSDYSIGKNELMVSGGLEEAACRIIVSAHYYQQHSSSRFDSRSGIFLCLYNEKDILVERCKLFENSSGNEQNFQILGKYDDIVTKSKSGYRYKIELNVMDYGANVEAHVLMCKIFPSNLKLPYHRMQDSNGEKGTYIGPENDIGEAHGDGALDYDNGSRFVGYFANESICDGVLYRGAHVIATIERGAWSREVNQSLVQKYPVGLLVYDSSWRLQKKSSRRSRNNYSSRNHRKYDVDVDYKRGRGSNYVNVSDDEDLYMSALRMHGADSVRDEGLSPSRSCDSYKSKIDLNLPVNLLPAFQGSGRRVRGKNDPDLFDDASQYKHGRSRRNHMQQMSHYDDDNSHANSHMSHSRGYGYRRNNGKKYMHFEDEEEDDRSKVDLDLPVDLLPAFQFGSRKSQGKKQNSLGFMNEYDSDRNDNHDEYSHNRSSYGGQRSHKKNDPESDLYDLFKNGPREERYTRNQKYDDDDDNYSRHSSLSRYSNRSRKDREHVNFHRHGKHNDSRGSLLDIMEEETSTFKDSSPVLGLFNLSEDQDQGRYDYDDLDRRSRLHKFNLESRDGNSSTRSTASTLSVKTNTKPMYLFLDEYQKASNAGRNFKLLVRGGRLMEGVVSIMISSTKFHDQRGTMQLYLTLYDQTKRVLQRKEIMRSSRNSSSSKSYVLIENGDSIVAGANVGCYYQLEYKNIGSSSTNFEIEGLVCKIFPSGRQTPEYEMKDPEGSKGTFMGKLGIDGKPHGKGAFHYESGHTFVGEFSKGSFKEGVYYFVEDPVGSMRNGKWDDQLDTSLARKYPIELQVFREKLSAGQSDSNLINTRRSNKFHQPQQQWSIRSMFCF